MSISEISDNARKVLAARYQAKDSEGKVVESVEGMFRRVADAIAGAERKFSTAADTAGLSAEFFELMTSLRFIPNSPTLMNAGRPLGQLSACFVLPVEDTMEGIFDSVKNAALIHKSGGGTGFSFSRLRQSGAAVRSTGGIASGPVSFMRVFNSATEAVKQGGTRRGANMGVLRVDHPDIINFINCKEDNGDITNFNISIGITEDFMKAVEDGSDYDLIDPRTKTAVGHMSAVKVFDEIVDHAWKNGEPGIIFIDRVNRDNATPTQGEIESTNPCGEQPLLPYESCNLGSINLVKMLRKTLTGYEVDYALLQQTVESAVHFLDNVIEVNNYPLEIIDRTTKAGRKIGLGVMGWADMLLILGIPYNSQEAVNLADKVMGFINTAGHAASAKLAEKRGAFPLFEESIYKDGVPIRNATITTIAPTGTISMIAGCSSGVEPVFAYAFIRNIMDGTEMIEINPVLSARLKEMGIYSEELAKKIAQEGSVANCNDIPEGMRRIYVCAQDIKPVDHIRIQAAFQRHTDNAVSKTVNFPKEATKNDVREAYMLAYEEGCKGVTIYRDGSREEQVLNIGKVNRKGDGESNLKRETEPDRPIRVEPRPRPTVTKGYTEKVKIGCGNLYVTTNYDENGICEVFTSTGKAGGCPSQSEATARLVSVSLRSGLSIEEVYDQLRGIRCPSTIRQQGMQCTSCPDAIAKVIMKVSKLVEDEKKNGISASISKERETLKEMNSAAGAAADVNANSSQIHVCPECGFVVEHEGGCLICRNCGFSKCG